MKDLWSLVRVALAILALPLAATAAVSALANSASTESVTVAELRAKAESRRLASFRNHMVSIDSTGAVRGRVVTSANESVAGLGDMKVFFIRNGEIVSQVYSRGDGSFEAFGLSEGDYSFVATGAKGFAAFGVRATTESNDDTNNLIEVGTISPKFERVMQILEGRLPTEVVSEIAASGGSRPAPGANRVEIVNGKLNGTLTTLAGGLQDAMVYLVKGNEKVAEVAAEASGSFSVDGLLPGMYEFVATTSTGMAAISFEAVSQEAGGAEAAAESVVENRNTFDAAAPSEALDVAVTMPQDEVIVDEQFIQASNDAGVASNAAYAQPYPMTGTDIGYGAAAGGSCGGAGDWGGYSGCGCGGGGAGMGPWASVARFAILGWILTELFDNIDFSDTNNNASPNNT